MSTQIDKLTPEQEAKMPEYVKKWVDISNDTSRLDPKETRRIVDGFRGLIDLKVDVPLMIVDNPLEAWVVCCLHMHGVPFDSLHSEMVEVFNGNPKKWDIPTASLPYQTGSFFAHVFSFYDYMLEELQIDTPKDVYVKYKIWEETAKIGCIYPLDELTVVSQKPTEIHTNENNVLHRDGGPALVYAGYGDVNVYSLNGVAVPEYLAVTPEEQLDINLYNKEKNADVRSEFVRKVGIERFLEKGKLVDTYKNYSGDEYEWWHKSEYELWDMASMFDGLEYAPYIKMVNQTTGIFHMEGVSPACRTVADALKERFGGRDLIIKAIS